MFTGIVEELGRFERHDGLRYRFGATTVLHGSRLGDSIAVNGCCLTLVDQGEDWWEADLSQETLQRTNLGALTPGNVVNLERPLRLQDRLGGHLVQGHVDGVGHVVAEVPDLVVTVPADLMRYCVEKGSITVGKRADLVVLEKNPLMVDPAQLEAIAVVETFSRGRSVYRR